MKILIYSGGLGNQLFCYSFSCYIKKKYPNHRVYGYYPSKMMNEHYGLEIDKWFDVSLPKQTWWTRLIILYFYLLKKVMRINCVDVDMRVCTDEKKTILFAFKQNKKYYDFSYNIKFNIDIESLARKNREVLDIIETTNSVFIHIRKGDYLSEKYKNKYEGTCPIDYYAKSINLIRAKVANPHFFCFSDDINWAKKNLNIKAVYIDWNKGENSPIDMFLMSNCKYAIIANSTFSYWAAVLGRRKIITIYPLKWENSKLGTPDLFPSDWVGF